MSTYNWERGSVLIPARAWPTFRKAFVQAWNAHQDARLARALAAHQHVESLAKGRRNFDRLPPLREYVRRTAVAREYGCDDTWDLERLLGIGQVNPQGEARTWTQRTRVPKRKDLDLRLVSKGGRFEIDSGDATITLVDDTRCVEWYVPENNHAVEAAHEHPVARALFKLLASVQWVRGSGGTIVGNDEYTRDSDEAGGGANYVAMRFGPLGEHRTRQRRAS